MKTLAWVVLAFAVGTIPSPYLIALLARRFDVIKEIVPALVAVRAHESVTTVSLVGVAAVAGHNFAPFLRKSGGRGLTTAAGVSLAIIPWAMVGSGVIALGGTIGK